MFRGSLPSLGWCQADKVSRKSHFPVLETHLAMFGCLLAGSGSRSKAPRPPKELRVSSIARLSQTELFAACAEYKVQTPSGALDLEVRTWLARAVVGGEGCPRCSQKSEKEHLAAEPVWGPT